MKRLESLVAEAQPLHGPWLEILSQYIEAGNETLDEFNALGMLEINTDAFLPEIVTEIGRSHLQTIGIDNRRGSGST